MNKGQKKTKVIFQLIVALNTCFWDGELMRGAARGNVEKRLATLGKFNCKPIRASIAATCSSSNCSQFGINRTSVLVLGYAASLVSSLQDMNMNEN